MDHGHRRTGVGLITAAHWVCRPACFTRFRQHHLLGSEAQSDAPSGTTDPLTSDTDFGILRQGYLAGIGYDIETALTPQQLFERDDVLVVARGSVVEVLPGRVYEDGTRFATVHLRASEVFKAPANADRNDLYLEIPLPDTLSLDEVAKGLPTDTELLVMAGPAADWGGRVVDEGAEPAGSAPLYTALPQAFLRVSSEGTLEPIAVELMDFEKVWSSLDNMAEFEGSVGMG